MDVLTSKRAGVRAPAIPKGEGDSRIRNYIGREGVLKSVKDPLVLALE
jgi:hypothetical protein